MRYGIRDGCLPGYALEDVFSTAGELGFDSVELDIGAEFETSEMWTESGRRQIAAWQSESGAELSSVCLGALWTYSFGDGDAGVRTTARDATLHTIEACAEVGARWILLPVTPGADVSDEEAVAHWIEEVGACAEKAAECEVFLALENVGRGYAQSAEGLLEIASAVNSPWVRAYYDFGNGLSLGNDPVAEMHLLGTDWITILHAKDPGGQLLGEGKVDFAAVVDAVKKIGYDGYIVLETPGTDDPRGAAQHNLAFLRKGFG